MADIYSTISLVSYILAGVAFAAAIIAFFALNVRGTYMELRGQTDKQWVVKQQMKPQKATKKVSKKDVPVETKTYKNTTTFTADGEAVTVLESGEEVTELGLVGVYEPGTDMMIEEATEIELDEESPTLMEEALDVSFRVVRKDIRIFSDEIIR